MVASISAVVSAPGSAGSRGIRSCKGRPPGVRGRRVIRRDDYPPLRTTARQFAIPTMHEAVKSCMRLRMILTLTSRKGGCGKTVLAMVIAAALAEQGGDVALLDADPNGSAYRWATDILRARRSAPMPRPTPSGSPICFLAGGASRWGGGRHGRLRQSGGDRRRGCRRSRAGARVARRGRRDGGAADRRLCRRAGSQHAPGDPGARSRQPGSPQHDLWPGMWQRRSSASGCPAGHHDQRGRRVWGNELFWSAPGDRHCGRGGGRR